MAARSIAVPVATKLADAAVRRRLMALEQAMKSKGNAPSSLALGLANFFDHHARSWIPPRHFWARMAAEPTETPLTTLNENRRPCGGRAFWHAAA